MQKTILLLILGFLLASCGKDEPGSQQSEEFVKFYGGSYSDEGTSVKAIEGGYYLLGTFSVSLNNKDLRLIRTDEFGNLVWEISLGDSLNDMARNMLVTSDNQVLVCGVYTHQQNNTDAFVAKIDAAGGIVFQKKYGGNYNQEATCIGIHPDGNIVLGGSTDADIYGEQILNKVKDIYILTLNSDGDSINSTIFQLDYEDYCTAITVLSDRTFLLAANTKTLGSSTDFFNPELLRLDKDGNMMEANALNFNSELSIIAIHEGAAGDVFLTGANTSGGINRVAVTKLSNFDIYSPDWTKVISDVSAFVPSKSIVSGNGNFICAGTLASLTSSDIVLCWIDQEGNFVKSKTVGGSASNSGLGLDMVADGSLVISGISTFEGNASAVLIKLKKE